jgi:hypothetical protein
MSEFHLDYERVRRALIKAGYNHLIDEDKLLRQLTYLIDEVRREENKTNKEGE